MPFGSAGVAGRNLDELLCCESLTLFSMPNSLLDWVAHYGYAGLFALLTLGIVGLPVPDETLLVFSGYLISRGQLNPFLTYLAGWGGSMCGISLSYWLGRTLGHSAVLRFGKYLGVTQQRLERTHQWFQRTGEWLLAFGYFLPGVRHFTALAAGTSELEFRTFAIFAWSGGAVWVAAFLSVGYFVGENWQRGLALVHRYTFPAAAVLLAVAALAWLIRRKLQKL
ncbi:MAG TPA: DedA family protein [Bryobacteraceae bacterium]|nr:DedA family protein [Bryobacteraceae bacterium]